MDEKEYMVRVKLNTELMLTGVKEDEAESLARYYVQELLDEIDEATDLEFECEWSMD